MVASCLTRGKHDETFENDLDIWRWDICGVSKTALTFIVVLKAHNQPENYLKCTNVINKSEMWKIAPSTSEKLAETVGHFKYINEQTLTHIL